MCQFCDSPHVVRARSGHSGGAWRQNQTEPKSQLSRTTCGESQILDLCHRGRRMTSPASKPNLTKSLHVFCRGPVCRFCDSPHVVRARSEHAGGAWQQNQTGPKSQFSRTTCGQSQILDLFHRGRRMTSPASKPYLTKSPHVFCWGPMC